MRYLCLVACFMIFMFETYAQSTYNLGAFPTLDHSGKLSERWEYGLYYFAAVPLYGIKPATGTNAAKTLLLYAENGLTFHFNDQIGATVAYVYQKENPFENNYVNENRVHLQIHYKTTRKNTEIKQRLRFDYRMLKPAAAQSSTLSHRMRYLIGFSKPFASNAKYYVSAYEECFFNTLPTTKGALSENWAGLMFGKKINSANKIETGPLYITWKTGNSSWYNQFYWQLTWVSHLNFSGKK
jgi:hypothetical protein